MCASIHTLYDFIYKILQSPVDIYSSSIWSSSIKPASNASAGTLYKRTTG